MFVLFPILVHSIIVLKTLDSNYSLAELEYYLIDLEEYFAGDNLMYSLSPSPKGFLQNPLLNFTKVPQYFSVPAATSIDLMQVLPFPSQTINYLVHGIGPKLYLYFMFLSQEYLVPGFSEAKFNGNISQSQIVQQHNISIIVLVEKNLQMDYQVFLVSVLEYDGYYAELSSGANLKLKELENMTSLYMSKGYITDFILFTGYTQHHASLVLYDISNLPYAQLYANIPLAVSQDHGAKMFSITYETNHYIYIPQDNKLIMLQGGLGQKLEISEKLILPIMGTVNSMELYNDNQQLLIGTTNGFIVVSLDLEQVYLKSFSPIIKEVYVTSAASNIFALIKADDKFYLQISSKNVGFYILGKIDIKVTGDYVNWAVFNFTDNFMLIITEGTSIFLYKISFSSGFLNFTSSDMSQMYTLMVLGDELEVNLTTEFVVERPLYGIGHVQVYDKDYYKIASFTNQSAEINLNLDDMFLGYDLKVSQASVTYMNEIDYFTEYFNVTPAITNFIDIPNDLDLFLYNHITALGNGVILYSTSQITYFENSENYKNVHVNFTLEKILNCGLGFIVHYQQNHIFHVLYTENITDFAHVNTYTGRYCEILKCSNLFLVCGDSDIIEIYNYTDVGISYISSLSNETLSETVKFIDCYIYLNSLLAVIVNSNSLQVFDLDQILSQVNVNPLHGVRSSKFQSIYSIGLPSIASSILVSSIQCYIVNQDHTMDVYDLNLKFLKRIYLGNYELISILSDFIVTVSDTHLVIVRGDILVTNSVIANVTISKISDFSLYLSGTYEIFIYTLSDTNLSSSYIPRNYNMISCTFNINSSLSDQISKSNYNATLNLEVSNIFNQALISIPVNLFINGQTIYKNNEAIQEIQDNSMRYSCETHQKILLDQIFLGQNLEVSSNSSLATVNHRFSCLFSNATIYDFDAIVYVPIRNNYLATADCDIFILDQNLQILNSLKLQPIGKTCTCNAISIISINYFCLFAVGCRYNHLITIQGPDYNYLPEYVLNFVSSSDIGLNLLQSASLNYAADKIKTISLLNGEFFLSLIDVYENVNIDGFYSNHLVLMRGNWYIENLGLYSYYVHPEIMNASYYYVTDFGGVYDPLFGNYYLYFTDVYYGLRIVEVHQWYVQGYISIKMAEAPMAMVICGQNLFVAMRSTTIYTYFFNNWLDPVLKKTFYPYMESLTSVPGTLRCSDQRFAKYLLLQVTDQTQSVYIHVVDNLSVNLASNIIDCKISNSSIGIFIDFIDSEIISLVFQENFTMYQLSPFELDIYTGDVCTRDIQEVIQICGSNQNNDGVNASFTIFIKKQYHMQTVEPVKMPMFIWIVLGISVVVIVAVGYFVSKKCRKKNTKCYQESALFNYEFQDFN